MKNKKKITPRMFKYWWNISDLNVDQIIADYVDFINRVSLGSPEEVTNHINDYYNGIVDYEKTWNDTGKEW